VRSEFDFLAVALYAEIKPDKLGPQRSFEKPQKLPPTGSERTRRFD
jgi:hypothetical protein